MSKRRSPIWWQGPVLVILLFFVAYGAYHLVFAVSDTNAQNKNNLVASSEEFKKLKQQIKAVQNGNALLEKAIAVGCMEIM